MSTTQKMMRTHNSRAMTLVELLIASILIGIVMIGVLSFNMSIKRIQESTDRDTLLSMRAEATITRMGRDARTAIGDPVNRGIIITPEGAVTNVAFRQDRDNTPTDYSDDTWVIYYQNGSSLYTCEQTVPTANQSSGPCTPSNATLVTSQLQSGSVTFETSAGPYVHMRLTFRYIPTAALHAITNPEHTVESTLSPLAHSR